MTFTFTRFGSFHPLLNCFFQRVLNILSTLTNFLFKTSLSLLKLSLLFLFILCFHFRFLLSSLCLFLYKLFVNILGDSLIKFLIDRRFFVGTLIQRSLFRSDCLMCWQICLWWKGLFLLLFKRRISKIFWFVWLVSMNLLALRLIIVHCGRRLISKVFH